MRYGGTVKPLAPVSVDQMVDWIGAIDFREWPQQHLRPDDPIRPAMVTDPGWHGFGEKAKPVVDEVMRLFSANCSAEAVFLSVVMPGQDIPAHVDHQGPHWVCRIHVPLLTNPESEFFVGGVPWRLDKGMAYAVNTEVEHSVRNNGATPRVHFMVDIHGDY